MLGKNENAKVTRLEICRNFLRSSMLIKKEVYTPPHPLPQGERKPRKFSLMRRGKEKLFI